MIRLLNQQEIFMYLSKIFKFLLSTAVLTAVSMNFAAIIFAFNATCTVEMTLSHLFLWCLSTQHDDQLLVFNRSLCVFISEGDFWVPVAARLPAFHPSQALG